MFNIEQKYLAIAVFKLYNFRFSESNSIYSSNIGRRILRTSQKCGQKIGPVCRSRTNQSRCVPVKGQGQSPSYPHHTFSPKTVHGRKDTILLQTVYRHGNFNFLSAYFSSGGALFRPILSDLDTQGLGICLSTWHSKLPEKIFNSLNVKVVLSISVKNITL
jgi:hypothetical protein